MTAHELVQGRIHRTHEFRISIPPYLPLFPFTLSLSIMVARSHSSPSLTFHFPPSLARSAVLEKEKGRGKLGSFCVRGDKDKFSFPPSPSFSGRPTDRPGTTDSGQGGGREGYRNGDAARPTDLIKMGRKRSHPFFPLFGLTDLGCQIWETVRARGWMSKPNMLETPSPAMDKDFQASFGAIVSTYFSSQPRSANEVNASRA